MCTKQRVQSFLLAQEIVFLISGYVCMCSLQIMCEICAAVFICWVERLDSLKPVPTNAKQDFSLTTVQLRFTLYLCLSVVNFVLYVSTVP